MPNNDEINTGNEIVALNDKEGRLAIRADIAMYEQEMKHHTGSERGNMDEINEKGLSEYITGGAYTRVLDIPAGQTIVSKLWNRERLWIIISGEVLIKTEQGDLHIVAPHIMQPPFGSKAAIFAVTDVKWAAVTGIKTEDTSEAEAEVEVEEYTDLTYPWDLLENKT